MTVLEACQSQGINIPFVCHHPRLKPLGMRFRTDLTPRKVPSVRRGDSRVFLRGRSFICRDEFPIQTSCTTKVAEGMDIWTNSPKARSASNEALKTLMTTTTITYRLDSSANP